VVGGTRLAGGGANAFFFGANAEGAIGGDGVADLFAVEFRKDPNKFFAEDVSTSPNFWVEKKDEGFSA